jgi:hypothetical protein
MGLILYLAPHKTLPLMKPRKPTGILILLACLAMLLGCSKDDTPGIKLDGFYMTDAAANHIGWHGPQDDDWVFKTSLPDRELAVLNFPLSNPAILMGTTEGTVSAKLQAYPNPFINAQTYQLNSSTPVVLRLAVVDKNLNVLYKYSTQFQNDYNLQYAFDDATYPVGGAYRVYFSVSAENKPNFKVGFGDIKKCSPAEANPHNCF